MDNIAINSGQAPTYLGIQEKTLIAWRGRRPPKGPKFLRYSGRCVRYLKQDLDAWIATQRVETEEAAVEK